MQSSAAILLLAASLVALPAGADEPPAATTEEAPKPPAAPALAPVPYPPRPYAMPYTMGPPWWTLPAPATERRSKGMMITGIILWGAGGIVTAIGAGLFASAELAPCDIAFGGSPPPVGGGPPPDRHGRSRDGRGEALGTARQALDLCGEPSKVNLGLGVLAAGVLGSGVGIPLFVVGNRKGRPKRDPDSATGEALPVLHVGAGSADLRWSF